MPLYKTITIDANTTVWIWKITEAFKDLQGKIALTANSKRRLEGMKSEMHQRGFISVRYLLKNAGFQDADLEYSRIGKPLLKNGQQISITHSYHFSAIIISNQPVGIDIEKQRHKIKLIRNKFIGNDHLSVTTDCDDEIKRLTMVWGVKESLYKLKALPGLSFKKNITITSCQQAQNYVIATVNFNKEISTHTLKYLEFEGFTCVYVKP